MLAPTKESATSRLEHASVSQGVVERIARRSNVLAIVMEEEHAMPSWVNASATKDSTVAPVS
jgi:hypothetical protein